LPNAHQSEQAYHWTVLELQVGLWFLARCKWNIAYELTECWWL